MRILLLTLFIFLGSFDSQGQFFRDVFKFSTFYSSASYGVPMKKMVKDYFVTQTNEVIDITEKYPSDYRFSIGFRKLARFDYERKDNIFYTGKENNVALTSGVGAVKGLEYLFQQSWNRKWGDKFTEQRFFVRHLGKNYIAKIEHRYSGMVDFKYQSAEGRFRLPIGNKFSISAGGIYRTHEKPFGYAPIKEYLSVDSLNWWDLANSYDYHDHYYKIENDENKTHDWYWTGPDGERVADSDLDFRRNVYKNIVNQFNDEKFSEVKRLGLMSAIIGYDFYHYKKNFWLHSWANVIPFHKYIQGNHEDFGYSNFLDRTDDKTGWTDYQIGLITGLKVGKHLGIFAEGEYTRFWDTELYSATVGLNYTL